MIPTIASHLLSTGPYLLEHAQPARAMDPEGNQALPTAEFIFVMTVLGAELTGFMACLAGACKLFGFILPSAVQPN